jgi:hypothetical protein
MKSKLSFLKKKFVSILRGKRNVTEEDVLVLGLVQIRAHTLFQVKKIVANHISQTSDPRVCFKLIEQIDFLLEETLKATPMVSKNDITGDSIISKTSSDAYQANYDAIFKVIGYLKDGTKVVVQEFDGKLCKVQLDDGSIRVVQYSVLLERPGGATQGISTRRLRRVYSDRPIHK